MAAGSVLAAVRRGPVAAAAASAALLAASALLLAAFPCGGVPWGRGRGWILNAPGPHRPTPFGREHGLAAADVLAAVGIAALQVLGVVGGLHSNALILLQVGGRRPGCPYLPRGAHAPRGRVGRANAQAAPGDVMNQLEKSLRELSTFDGVLEFHNEHFWAVAPGKMAGSLHVRIRRDANEQAVLAQVSQKLAPLVAPAYLAIQVRLGRRLSRCFFAFKTHSLSGQQRRLEPPLGPDGRHGDTNEMK